MKRIVTDCFTRSMNKLNFSFQTSSAVLFTNMNSAVNQNRKHISNMKGGITC